MASNGLVGISVGGTQDDDIIRRFEDGHDVFDLIDDIGSSSAMLSSLSGASIENIDGKILLLSEEDEQRFNEHYVSSSVAENAADEMEPEDVDLIGINDIISGFNSYYENEEEITFREYLTDLLLYGEGLTETVLEILDALGLEHE